MPPPDFEVVSDTTLFQKTPWGVVETFGGKPWETPWGDTSIFDGLSMGKSQGTPFDENE